MLLASASLAKKPNPDEGIVIAVNANIETRSLSGDTFPSQQPDLRQCNASPQRRGGGTACEFVFCTTTRHGLLVLSATSRAVQISPDRGHHHPHSRVPT